MNQDTFDQAVVLQDQIDKYNAILANEGNLFPENLGEHFDKAQEIDKTTFNAWRESINTSFRAQITTSRNNAQTAFDNLQDS